MIIYIWFIFNVYFEEKNAHIYLQVGWAIIFWNMSVLFHTKSGFHPTKALPYWNLQLPTGGWERICCLRWSWNLQRNETSWTHEFSGANLLLVSWYHLRRVSFHTPFEACWVLWCLGCHPSLNLYQWCLDNCLELLDDKLWLENIGNLHYHLP